MVYALPIVHTRERTLLNPYSILSIVLFFVVIYMFFGGMDAWPKFLKDLPELLVYLGMVLLFLNGLYAFLRPSLTLPECIGCIEVNDELKELTVTINGRKTLISFQEINSINFTIRGAKELMGNFHGNLNFVEITYNLFISRIKCEFVIESPSQVYTIKNAFNRIWVENPKVDIHFHNDD